MSVYLISYDITVSDAFEYGPLWDRLKAMGAIKILYSEWVFVADEAKAANVYNSIRTLIQGKDRLIVNEVTKDAHWDKLMISDDEFRDILRKSARL
jgi:hypothetical protein